MNRCVVWLISVSVVGWQSALSSEPRSSGSERPTATAASASLSVPQLKYLLIARFGPVGGSSGIFYCDPDRYPVDFGSEPKRAQDTFPVIQKDAETFDAITTHLGWDSANGLTSDKQLEVYREFKRLKAINLVPKGESYAFSLRISDAARKGWITEGVISKQGEISIGKRETTALMCPICLAKGTPIDTPEGPIAVQALQPGMVIWTTTLSGARTPATIVQTTHMPIPPEYELIHFRLDDGRELTAAPAHPLGDGRLLAGLVPSDAVGNARILDLNRITPTSSATYDVLPDGETGEYWANGILLRSTLVEKSRR